MERRRTPTEARGGVVGGRVTPVLDSSLFGACAGLGLIWFLFMGAH
jgi:hypothetical protein